LANRIGKSPEYISHRLQLLQLPQDVLSRVGSQISTSHAEELAWLEDEKTASRLAEYTVEKKLSVHELHELLKLEKRRHKRRDSPSLPEGFDSRTRSEQEEGSQVEEVLKTSVVALRYLMYYLDNCVHSTKGEKGLEFAKFLTNERYKVHQILDDFVAAEVKVKRARNGGARVLGLALAP
jgi:ParB family chromosome partitioning protein